jgi:hypothetical protein
MDMLAEYGRTILSLIVVFSLLGLTVWKLGRGRGSLPLARLPLAQWTKPFRRKGGSLEPLLERLQHVVLTPQHTLHVLRFHGREMLVATHPQGCTLLDREDEPTLVARGAGA